MLRRYLEKIMIDDVKDRRETNDVGTISVSLQQLPQTLRFMLDGRVDKAMDNVSSHWTFADCLRMHVFFEE